jgi:hypothetical protein
MINKNKYREFLLNRMERETPVLAEAGGLALSTPATPIRPLHPIRRWLVPTLAGILGVNVAFFGIAGIDEWIHTPKKWVMSLEERNYVAGRVYNTIVKDDESIPMANETAYPRFTQSSTAFQFFYITIVDSYYIQTIYDTDLHPFFDESIRCKTVNTVVTLLKFHQGFVNGEEQEKEWMMIMLNFEGKTVGFLGGPLGEANNSITSIDDYAALGGLPNTAVRFFSGYFLSQGSTVTEDGVDGIINIDISGTAATRYQIDGQYLRKDSEKGFYTEPFVCAIDNTTYKRIGKEETIDLINSSTVERRKGQAVILDIDKSYWILRVNSTALPTLKTIRFNKLQSKAGISDYDLNGILAVGDTITFDYYVRYEHYEPVDLFSETIYVDK